jgi:hypothetical protein
MDALLEHLAQGPEEQAGPGVVFDLLLLHMHVLEFFGTYYISDPR